MLTIRLSLSKGIVLIPKRNTLNKVNNGLELIKVLDDAQNNNVKVKILKNDIVLDGSIATQKPSPEWISKEIDKKTTELLENEVGPFYGVHYVSGKYVWYSQKEMVQLLKNV